MTGQREPQAGRRIRDGLWFAEPRQAGDYGAVEVAGQGLRWFNRPPNAQPEDPDCVLNEKHVVVTHADGTITVHASIANHVYDSEAISGGPITAHVRPWHGHLERGVWREA